MTDLHRTRLKWSWLGLLFLATIFAGQAHASDMVLIPGGPFQMGSQDGEVDERPVHTVYVDAFYMERHLVTNADYSRFLNVFGNRGEGGKKWLDTDGPFSWWLCKIKKKIAILFLSLVMRIIRWLKYHGMVQELMPSGWESDCRQRRNGKKRPGAG